ncbi:MAG TPA: lysophospholipid acyltransferase family protein [Longimicrobiales bacterium]|nr:lysophospholipid acyltransferase family protein [Longimicrobiales bacterium]
MPSGPASADAVRPPPERAPVYRLFQATVRGLSWLFLPSVEVRGLEHVPEAGPCLVVANHQSVLDPILIQSFCPRPLHTMTKSTQFGVPVLGWLVREHLLGFPVRRYQIDPQAVRVALRRLAAGRAVGVYVEGERSWDGQLQAPRLGTLRLLLKAGVPVIPCAIDGSYDVWPRWGGGLKRAPVRIAFGAPLPLPRLDDRRARERALDATGAAIIGALRGLLGNSHTSVDLEVGNAVESGRG